MTFRSTLLAAALSSASLLAHAGLISSTVTSQYYFNGGVYGPSSSFTADGANHVNFMNYFQVKVTGNQVIYDYSIFNGSAGWNTGATWTDGPLHIMNGNLLDFIGAPNIQHVALDASSTMAGFDASRISFDHNSIAVDWAGLSFNNSTRLVLNVDANNVPEPASYALVLVALAGLGLAMRRSKA